MPKLIKLLESTKDIDIAMECVPMLCVHSVGLVKFFNWAINQDQMTRLLLAIERDWKSLKLQRDIKLLSQFTDRGRKINSIYATAMYGILVVYLLSPGIPKILDIILPLNQSRPRVFLYQTEYFCDQNEYYVHILIHAYVTVPLSVTVLVYFDNLFAIFINHTCGMCEVLKNYLEDIGADDADILERIKMCANLQTNIIEFISDLESAYTIALLVIVGLNMMVVTTTGMMAVIKVNEPSEVIRYTTFNSGTIFHLFWSSWQGHNLIVQSETVFTSVYQNNWYRIPCKYQKMLLPLMMRSLTPCQITAGKLYVMSMNSFGGAMRMTLSFLTLLLSVR
ncbi:putative odorant receptor 85d [Fopius arisanus]|uniref:Odorant receptor 85d n=1 Tax=Fopius arisanus TaxID=64838 RepID=A0A9R1T2Z2_9HYME|nr:PREDICTED: putative odorant receptor 85d [Fopius arisanus]